MSCHFIVRIQLINVFFILETEKNNLFILYALPLISYAKIEIELTFAFVPFRSVFETLITNHFPAPDRRFVDDLQNANQPSTESKRSPSPEVKRRGADLKRKVLENLGVRTRAKRMRVVYSDDSDSEKENEKMDSNESDDEPQDSDDEEFAGKK